MKRCNIDKMVISSLEFCLMFEEKKKHMTLFLIFSDLFYLVSNFYSNFYTMNYKDVSAE